jgi:hypothetical protein
LIQSEFELRGASRAFTRLQCNFGMCMRIAIPKRQHSQRRSNDGPVAEVWESQAVRSYVDVSPNCRGSILAALFLCLPYGTPSDPMRSAIRNKVCQKTYRGSP